MNELIIKEDLVPAQVFTETGIDPILKGIKDEVAKFVPDMTTEKGRKEIITMARKVSSSKTYLEEKALELTADWAKKKKIVDASRSKFKKELDTLRDEVRKPVTDWENIEKTRISKYDELLRNLRCRELVLHATDFESNIKMLSEKIENIGNMCAHEDAREFALAVEESIKDRAIFLKSTKASQEVLLEEKIELDALREEKRLRDIKDREDAIAKEAAETEKRKAQEIINKAEKEKQEAVGRENKLKQEKIDAEKRALYLAEKAKKDAIMAKEEEAHRVENEKIAGAKAIEDAKIAERKKIEAENFIKAEKEAERQKDVDHRKKVISEIREDLGSIAMIGNEDFGLKVTSYIADGKIRHVKVVF